MSKSDTTAIKRAYLNPRTGYVGAAALYKKLKGKYTRRHIASVISKLTTVQLHRPYKKANNAPIIKKHPSHLFIMDLMDVTSLAPGIGKTKFLLNVMDLASRFVWSKRINSKKADVVLNALKLIIKQSGKPKIINSDRGLEFTNKEMVAWLKSQNIKQTLSNSYDVASHSNIERWHGNIRRKIGLDITNRHKNNHIRRPLINLDDLVFNYNNTVHSSTNAMPSVLYRTHAMATRAVTAGYNRQIKKAIKRKTRDTNKLKVGDYVRIPVDIESPHLKNKLGRKRSGAHMWSYSIYKIIEVIPGSNVRNTSYKLQIDGKKWHRNMFGNQLQKTDKPITIRVPKKRISKAIIKSRTSRAPKPIKRIILPPRIRRLPKRYLV